MALRLPLCGCSDVDGLLLRDESESPSTFSIVNLGWRMKDWERALTHETVSLRLVETDYIQG